MWMRQLLLKIFLRNYPSKISKVINHLYINVICENLQMTIKLNVQSLESQQRDSIKDSQLMEKSMIISAIIRIDADSS